MEQHEICPWCQSEIVWDEELGPEEICPHCENEIKGYRTLSLHLEQDEDDDKEASEEEYDGVDDFTHEEESGFRSTSRIQLALEEKTQLILDEQEEVPECPSCREYMLETGRQTIFGADSDYKPSKHRPIGEALLPAPFQTVWYVCPGCYQMQNRLSVKDRDDLIKRLSGGIN